MTVPAGWVIVPQSAPETSEPVPGEIYLTCAASRDVFSEFDGCTAVSVTVGWEQRPETEHKHSPEGMECLADRQSGDSNPVVAVDFLDTEGVEVDGHAGELSSWLATCADGRSSPHRSSGSPPPGCSWRPLTAASTSPTWVSTSPAPSR